MPNKQLMKSCATALAVSLTFAAFSDDKTVTETEDISEDIDGALVVDGGNATVTTSISATSYTVKSGGTLTIGADRTLTLGQSSNYVGCQDAPGDSLVDANGVSHLILEEGSTLKDTAQSGVNMYAARYGGAAEITVCSNAFLDLFWKYLYASCNSEETRNGYGRTTLNLYGRANIGEIHVADYFWNQGGSQDPLTWPEAMTINVYEGGWLGTRSISRNDNSLTRINFNGGGKLTFRWRCNFFSGGAGAEVMNFASGTTELNTAFEHEGNGGATIHRNTTYLTGAGSINKTGDGLLTIATECNTSDFTGDIYLTRGTLNFPIVADGINRKVYFQGGALAVPENGTFVTVANGGSVEFVSVDGADIKLVSNGNAKIANNGTSVRCSGTGKPVFEGTFAPGGEIQCGTNSNGAFAIPAGVTYGKVGSGTDTIIVNGLSNINIHEGKLRTDKFRFWRMVFDDNAGTGNGVQICDLRLYGSSDDSGDAIWISTIDREWAVTSHSTWNNDNESVRWAFDYPYYYGDNYDWKDTKFLSFDLFSGNADIVIEFPTPMEIRAYQWYTADDCLDPNNGDCRTPTAWHWLASTDGENWIEVARESGFNPATSSENPAECATNAYTCAGTWWLDYSKTHLPNPLASSTITIDSGASLLIDKAESVKVGNVVNNGGAVELAQAGSVLNVGTDSTTYLLGGGTTGSGGIEKTGSGTTRANGVNTYSGDTVISAGTYAIVPSQTAAPKFFRFTFTNTQYGNSQFAWLKLCSADGTIQSTGLSDCGTVGLAASVLAQGTYSRMTSFEQWGDGNFANVFDESADTKFGGAPNGQIVLRLRDDAAPIAYYDVMSGGDDHAWGRRLTGFKLESSTDGETWQTVSEVNVTDRTCTSKTWYSGTPCGYFVRHVTGTTTDATIPAASAVEVKPGATLAVETAMEISKLRINLDDEQAAAGSIVGFSPATNGTLLITCSDADALNRLAARQDIPIGLDFEGFSASANETLKSWSCFVNGAKALYRLELNAGTGRSLLRFKRGFMFLVR